MLTRTRFFLGMLLAACLMLSATTLFAAMDKEEMMELFPSLMFDTEQADQEFYDFMTKSREPGWSLAIYHLHYLEIRFPQGSLQGPIRDTVGVYERFLDKLSDEFLDEMLENYTSVSSKKIKAKEELLSRHETEVTKIKNIMLDKFAKLAAKVTRCTMGVCTYDLMRFSQEVVKPLMLRLEKKSEAFLKAWNEMSVYPDPEICTPPETEVNDSETPIEIELF